MNNDFFAKKSSYRTLFVFTSDHGELFGAHGRRAKNIFYEEAVRVPFLVRCPGTVREGSSDVCLNTVDVILSIITGRTGSKTV